MITVITRNTANAAERQEEKTAVPFDDGNESPRRSTSSRCERALGDVLGQGNPVQPGTWPPPEHCRGQRLAMTSGWAYRSATGDRETTFVMVPIRWTTRTSTPPFFVSINAGTPARKRWCSMAKRLVVTDIDSDAWDPVTCFEAIPEDIPAVARLWSWGVHKVRFLVGCIEPGRFFANLRKVVAREGFPVDVSWLEHVQDLCVHTAVAIDGQLRSAVEPIGDDPEGNILHEVEEGNFLLSVEISFRYGASVSVDLMLPIEVSPRLEVTE